MSCGSSRVRSRPDLERVSQLESFVDWLLGCCTQERVSGGRARSFREQRAWCWKVAPLIPNTGEIFNEIQIDGTYLGKPKTGFLSAIDGGSQKVIAWRWAKSETTQSWCELLEKIPPPKVVVTDGGSGIGGALARCWPETKIGSSQMRV